MKNLCFCIVVALVTLNTSPLWAEWKTLKSYECTLTAPVDIFINPESTDLNNMFSVTERAISKTQATAKTLISCSLQSSGNFLVPEFLHDFKYDAPIDTCYKFIKTNPKSLNCEEIQIQTQNKIESAYECVQYYPPGTWMWPTTLETDPISQPYEKLFKIIQKPSPVAGALFISKEPSKASAIDSLITLCQNQFFGNQYRTVNTMSPDNSVRKYEYEQAYYSNDPTLTLNPACRDYTRRKPKSIKCVKVLSEIEP